MKYFSLLVFIFSSLLATAQNKKFPVLTGETVDEKTVSIPADTKGKYTLVGMAFSQKSENDLKTWFQPVYSTFIEKNGENSLDFDYDVNVYFVPMFTGVNQAAAGTAKKRMKETLSKELVPHVLLYKGELKKYSDELNFEHKDKPYFYVLDKQGNIIYSTSGAYTDDKIAEIEELVEE